MAATVTIIGGGPGGLIAAEMLAVAGATVTVYDRMPSVGRKLLLAGRSGLNLTHAEPLDRLLDRYGPDRDRLEPVIRAFPPEALREWCHGLGQPTFVGSSGRVFPEAWRATPLLRAWLARLGDLGVTMRPNHRWTGWADPDNRSLTSARFVSRDSPEHVVTADVVILALGGGSWPRTGSDAAWVPILRASGAAVDDVQAANSGVSVDWPAGFAAEFAGTPLKNLRASCGTMSVRGEAVITRSGLESGVVYALSRAIRSELNGESPGTARQRGAAGGWGGPDNFGRFATVRLNLLPDHDPARLAERLARRRPGDSRSSHIRRATGLPRVSLALASLSGPLPDDPAALVGRLTTAEVRVTGLAPLDRAISTAGGLRLDELDTEWMIRRRPGVYALGEMVAWDAPTGGYLLQATMSSGVHVARAVARRLSLTTAPAISATIPGEA